jgi:WD40 repeat protein
MADQQPSRDGRRRYLIATGVTRDLPLSHAALRASVDLMAGLFTGAFGYQRVTDLGIDPTAEELRAQLRDFCESCDPEDIVAYYHTGHAEIGQRGHRLRTGGEGNYYVTSMPTEELAELMLEGTKLQRALIILDTCFAGQGGAETLLSGMKAASRSSDRTLTIVTAAAPAEQIRAGDFAKLFEHAVNHPATAGHEPPYLPLSAIVGQIKKSKKRPPWQTVSENVLNNTEEVQPFLPNPRFDPRLHGLDLFTQLRIQQRQLRAEDIRTHFLPKARGTDVAGEASWRFMGRHAALRDLAAWLRDGNGFKVRVVTGDPGSGKSAVIGRLVILADPQRRDSVPLDGIPADTIPDAGAIDVALHARGLTTGQVIDALSAAIGVQVGTPGELLTALRGRRLVAAIDAIDESVGPQDLVDRLLRPLVDADLPQLRLLLGTRRHLIAGLGPGAEVLDLDAENYADPASLAAYAARCLRESQTGSPYVTADSATVSAVAQAIADAAGRSFLVALITARTLALNAVIPDPADPAWRARLPATAAEAMHQDLQSRLGADADRARGLLLPLAYAAGAGLPWEDVWAPLASVISRQEYTDEDIIWLRAQAGYYIVEAQETGRSVYRLYHATLAEYLRQDHSEEEINVAIVDFLTEHTRRISSSADPDWLRAHPYVRAHLATHAARARRLDPLILNPGYLLAAVPAGVLAALPAARSADSLDASAAYQRIVHHLDHGTTGQKLAYLELSSCRIGARILLDRLREYPGKRPWRPLWTRWATESPHRVLTTDDRRPIIYIDYIPNKGHWPLVLAISDLRWHIWNAITGERILTHDMGSVPIVEARTVTGKSGEMFLVTVDSRRDMQIFDLAQARMLHRVSLGQAWISILDRLPDDIDLVNLVSPPIVCAQLADGTPVAVSVSHSEFRSRTKRPVVAIWDVGSGMLRTRVRLQTKGLGYAQPPKLTCIRMPGERTAAVARYPDSIRFWEHRFDTYAVDLTSGEQLFDPDGSMFDGVSPDEEDPGSLSGSAAAALPELRLDGESIEVTARKISSEPPNRATLTGHSDDVSRAIWLPSKEGEATIVSGSKDGTIRVWANPFDNVRHTIGETDPPITYFDILQLPDGRILGATAEGHGYGDGEPSLCLWDFTSDTRFGRISIPSPASAITCLWVERDIPAIAAYGTDRFLRGWDLRNGEPLFERFGDPYSFATQISAVLLPDGQSLLVSAGHNDNAAALWNARTGEFIRWLRRHTGWVNSSTCGLYKGRPAAVTVGYDHRICIWDLPRGRLLRTFGPARSRSIAQLQEINSIQLAELGPRRPVAVTRNAAGSVRLRDGRNWRTLAVLEDVRATSLHTCCVQLTQDRLLIASADDDTSIRLWLVTPGEHGAANYVRLERIDLESRILGLRVSPDLTLIVNTSRGMTAIKLESALWFPRVRRPVEAGAAV